MSHRAHASFDSSQLASQSPPDLRVRAEMWQGQVPILCHLAPHEVTSMEDPPPIALLVPRMSYFPLVLSEVRAHFRDMTPAMEDELWLEYEGIPLKWNIPIGVLFDLLCPSATPPSNEGSGGGGVGNHSTSPDMLLPWRLTVHFQSFPLKKLLRCKTLFTVRQHYLNTWKEACYLRFASSRIAQACLQSDHQRLWDALTHLREDVHVQTNARIVSSGIMGATGNTPQLGMAIVQAALENKSVEDLPIRVYVHCTRATHEEGMNSDQHMCPIQRSVKPRDAHGHERTVGDLIQQMLPALIDTSAYPAANASAESAPSPTTSTTTPTSPPLSLLPSVRLLVQGFTPPLTTPLSWLSTYCSHPDGFLYVSVQLVEAESEAERLERMDPFAAGTSRAMHDHSLSMGSMGGSVSGGGGGFGGMMTSMTSFHPSTLPGYHAASNAVNVVYQNLPSLLLTTIPTMTSLFGGATTTTTMHQPATSPHQQTSPPSQQAAFSSASAMEPSPPPAANDLLLGGELDSPEGEQEKEAPGFLRGGEDHHSEEHQQAAAEADQARQQQQHLPHPPISGDGEELP